jgi:hypothetical protein
MINLNHNPYSISQFLIYKHFTIGSLSYIKYILRIFTLCEYHMVFFFIYSILIIQLKIRILIILG